MSLTSLIFSLLIGANCFAKTVQISIHHGYLDGRPINTATYDLYHKSQFQQQLTRPCSESSYRSLCGFSFFENQYGDYFYQRKMKDTIFLIKEYSSSLTPNDVKNSLDSKDQDFDSKRARSFFLQALSESDIVIYEGHSRYGGGPDFSRPVLTKQGLHDQNYYVKQFRGFKDMLDALSTATKLPAYLGLYSCDSAPHFKKSMQEDFPQIHFLSTQRIVKSDEISEMIWKDLDPILQKLSN